MTAKDKAIELSQKHLLINKNVSKHWKECALIVVYEIMKLPNLGRSHNRDASQYDYWQEVKEEIINL